MVLARGRSHDIFKSEKWLRIAAAVTIAGVVAVDGVLSRVFWLSRVDSVSGTEGLRRMVVLTLSTTTTSTTTTGSKDRWTSKKGVAALCYGVLRSFL